MLIRYGNELLLDTLETWYDMRKLYHTLEQWLDTDEVQKRMKKTMDHLKMIKATVWWCKATVINISYWKTVEILTQNHITARLLQCIKNYQLYGQLSKHYTFCSVRLFLKLNVALTFRKRAIIFIFMNLDKVLAGGRFSVETSIRSVEKCIYLHLLML